MESILGGVTVPVPVYIVLVTIASLLLSPALARNHLAIGCTSKVRESPAHMAKHEASVRSLTRIYRISFLAVGILGILTWLTGLGWG